MRRAVRVGAIAAVLVATLTGCSDGNLVATGRNGYARRNAENRLDRINGATLPSSATGIVQYEVPVCSVSGRPVRLDRVRLHHPPAGARLLGDLVVPWSERKAPTAGFAWPLPAAELPATARPVAAARPRLEAHPSPSYDGCVALAVGIQITQPVDTVLRLAVRADDGDVRRWQELDAELGVCTRTCHTKP